MQSDTTASILQALAAESGHSVINDGLPLLSTNRAIRDRLKSCFQQSHFQSVLLRLLEDIVKPDLSAYKHARLTEQGTQRIRPRLPDNVQQEVDPPAETINILEWVSERLEKATVQSNLHLILPPILILLDSIHANVRIRATIILSNILERIDESTLAKTGLAEVLWTALIPNLASLPPITDLEESVRLLKVTYTALISLARLWQSALRKRIPLLDKLVRDGVIYAMVFAGDKLKVAQVELESLDILVREMGIYFVKHLKYVIPVISSILANPLGSNHPPQLLLALQVLETIMSICWPRIGHHHQEILRGTTICWRYLRLNEDSPELTPVREALKRVNRALAAASPEAKIDLLSISVIDSYYAELSQS